jgi:hypothetical protein
MHTAFVCAKLRLSTGTGDRVTELVAVRIIELAMAGERDGDRLTARVLAEFGIENDGSLWRHQPGSIDQRMGGGCGVGFCQLRTRRGTHSGQQFRHKGFCGRPLFWTLSASAMAIVRATDCYQRPTSLSVPSLLPRERCAPNKNGWRTDFTRCRENDIRNMILRRDTRRKHLRDAFTAVPG